MSPKKTCPPPDPHTRHPTFKLPPQACDAHCHVFGPAAEFPYYPTSTYEPPDASKFDLRALHDKIGVERAVLVQASCHGPDNRALLDALAWSGGDGAACASPIKILLMTSFRCCMMVVCVVFALTLWRI